MKILALVLAAFLAVAACGGVPEGGGSSEPKADASSSGKSESASALTGAFDVDGRELYLSCTGSGGPTMVLESGEDGSSMDLDPIRDRYDGRVMVCGYDRANNGRSGSAPTPRKSDDVTADLHGLLETAKVPGPYVLVGQSAGGTIVQAYAARFPEEVAGVVAMNPVPPWKEWSTRGFAKMTPAERMEETAYFQGENGEALDYVDMSKRIAESPTPEAPFHLLISSIEQCESPEDICGRTYPAATRMFMTLAERWPNGRFSQVPASHEIYLTDVRTVQQVIDDVLSRTR